MNEAKRIEVLELRDLIDKGTVTLLDMRRDWDQSQDKLPGAIRVDPDRYREYAGALPGGRPVITYCT